MPCFNTRSRTNPNAKRSSKASSVVFISNPISANACATVDCGQGTCRETDSSLLGFECDCYSGWKHFQIGPLVLPPCIIPNCTLDFSCGEGSPPPPSPPNFNLSDPCTLTWCGDGSCKTNGTGYECDCNAGSDNLLDMPDLPCFKECSLGADCHGVGLGKPPPPPPPFDSLPPDQSSSYPGPRELKRASSIEHCLKVLLILGAVILPRM
ncbi:hypothetical protein DITRI_Ditri03aG0072200 [Diplodiscus trichospermus]